MLRREIQFSCFGCPHAARKMFRNRSAPLWPPPTMVTRLPVRSGLRSAISLAWKQRSFCSVTQSGSLMRLPIPRQTWRAW
ncbi:hypothetical protein DJ55_4170 [Yersinia pseudotuberculosis]|nr:hypothetical protein DJ55_4170 [Yersinia pseudotuberculosis]